MFLPLLTFVTIVSAVVALLEIQIEGKNGWAKKLPTWRVNNKLTLLILGPYHPLTGYHFFLGALIITFFHFPFFLGMPWSGALELRILSMYFFFWLLEDFLWFIFNPNFGISNFRKGKIPWHTRWFLGVPYSYYKFLVIAGGFYYLSFFV